MAALPQPFLRFFCYASTIGSDSAKFEIRLEVLRDVTYDTVGILYHPSVAEASALAEEARATLAARSHRVWSCSAWDDDALRHMADTDLLLCIGGDGTMLRAARAAIPHPIPLIGVNMGRLAFLSELGPDEALSRLHEVLSGAGRIERRTMLRAEVSLPGGAVPHDLACQHALNDVGVGRSGGRPVDVHVIVDGVQIEVVRADGVVVSTATGSTGYNLSAGGPVLHPEAEEIVLTPVAAHLSRVRPIVLPSRSRVELRLATDVRAVASFDGQVDYTVTAGMGVHVRRSEHIARFIRLGPPSDFYRNLTHLLDFDRRSDQRE
jgi:NAD+ kinase